MARSQPRAAQELVVAVRARGGELQERQVERWSQRGALLSAERRWLGRGRGSESVYPPGSVDRALVVLEMLKQRRNLDAVVLELFMRGFEVQERELKSAYQRAMTSAQAALERHVKSDDDPLTAAEAIALAIAGSGGPAIKDWRRRLRARRHRETVERLQRQRQAREKGHSDVRIAMTEAEREPTGAVLISALTNLVMVAITGAAASPAGLDELAEATGIANARREHVPGHEPLLSDDRPNDQLFSPLRPASFAEDLRHTTMAELEQARKDILTFMAFAETSASLARELDENALGLSAVLELPAGIQFGLMLLPLVHVRQRDPDRAAHNLVDMQQSTPGLKAYLELVLTVEPRDRPLLSPSRLFMLPEQERERIFELIRVFASAHPTKAELVRELKTAD